jgi:hypothetical protein
MKNKKYYTGGAFLSYNRRGNIYTITNKYMTPHCPGLVQTLQ